MGNLLKLAHRVRSIVAPAPRCRICKAKLVPMGKDNVLDCPMEFCELSYYP